MKKVGGFWVFYSPTLIATLNAWSLTGLAEIRWLTSWDNNARTKLTPELGIELFDLARDPALMLEKDEAAFENIKSTARPLVWIDGNDCF